MENQLKSNRKAFGDMLAFSEGTSTHPLTCMRGYNVIVTRQGESKAKCVPTSAIIRLQIAIQKRLTVMASPQPQPQPQPDVISSFTATGLSTINQITFGDFIAN